MKSENRPKFVSDYFVIAIHIEGTSVRIAATSNRDRNLRLQISAVISVSLFLCTLALNQVTVILFSELWRYFQV